MANEVHLGRKANGLDDWVMGMAIDGEAESVLDLEGHNVAGLASGLISDPLLEVIFREEIQEARVGRLACGWSHKAPEALRPGAAWDLTDDANPVLDVLAVSFRWMQTDQSGLDAPAVILACQLHGKSFRCLNAGRLPLVSLQSQLRLCATDRRPGDTVKSPL